MATSTTARRTFDVHGHRYALAATPAAGQVWTANIVEYALLGGAHVLRRPMVDARSPLHDQFAMMTSYRGSGLSADEALADLETKIRAAVARAVRADADATDQSVPPD